MAEPDRIYGWISNVINSCNHPSHFEPCEVLITFYEKKGADAYFVAELKKSLEIKILLVQEEHKNKERISKEDEIWDMYNSGNYTIKQIAEKVNMKLLKCDEIINNKMRR